MSNDTRVRLTDFEGNVMAWSFGSTSGIIRGVGIELEIPRLARNVPALIGQSPSESEMVDGDVCLFHPVVTCLAGRGEIFNPPLLLRFSVGDAKESGSDVGSSNEDEESYKAYLRSRYSVVKREEGSSTWVPIDGEIKKMHNGVFVLEAQVFHFTDYALNHKSLIPRARLQEVGEGQAEIFEVNGLPQNVSIIVNKGDKNIMVFYWRRRTVVFYTSRMEGSVGAAPVEERAAVEVYSKFVPSNQSVALNNTTSLEVAWATVEKHGDHRSVTVWGRSTLDHKNALVIGPLPESVYAVVRNLRIADGEHIGNKVREILLNV